LDSRLAKLRELVTSYLEGIPMLISSPENRRYLSGFTGSAGYLLIGEQESLLITDFRYVEQASAQAAGFRVVRGEFPLLRTVAEVVSQRAWKRLGFEDEHVSFADYRRLQDLLPGVELVPGSQALRSLRQIKEPGELSCIRRAARMCDAALEAVLPLFTPGVEEAELAWALERRLREAGAEDIAFPPIVASGPRSSLPHGRASHRRLQRGDLVTVDFGARYQGYCSDMTRTVAVGEVSADARRVYEVVARAQQAGLQAIRAGASCREVDAAARGVIEEEGFGEYFGHGLGHGVGLSVHEGPRLSPHAEEDAVLQPGMVVTVEPGVYLPGRLGVRIEDLVLVTEDGCEIISTFRKDLLILGG